MELKLMIKKLLRYRRTKIVLDRSKTLFILNLNNSKDKYNNSFLSKKFKYKINKNIELEDALIEDFENNKLKFNLQKLT